MKTYVVCYRKWDFSIEDEIEVRAKNKEEAYDLARYGMLPAIEINPYSVYVFGTINPTTGEIKPFKNCYGY